MKILYNILIVFIIYYFVHLIVVDIGFKRNVNEIIYVTEYKDSLLWISERLLDEELNYVGWIEGNDTVIDFDGIKLKIEYLLEEIDLNEYYKNRLLKQYEKIKSINKFDKNFNYWSLYKNYDSLLLDFHKEKDIVNAKANKSKSGYFARKARYEILTETGMPELPGGHPHSTLPRLLP